jgi:hypothetical protein
VPLAKHAQPAFLGDFYRRIAVRYMFMAEDLLKEAGARGNVAPQSDHSSRRRISRTAPALIRSRSLPTSSLPTSPPAPAASPGSPGSSPCRQP